VGRRQFGNNSKGLVLRAEYPRPNEASLILGKVYRIVPDARAAKDVWYGSSTKAGTIICSTKAQFAFDFPQAVRKKILALQKAS
jgi:hypothetical protein